MRIKSGRGFLTSKSGANPLFLLLIILALLLAACGDFTPTPVTTSPAQPAATATPPSTGSPTTAPTLAISPAVATPTAAASTGIVSTTKAALPSTITSSPIPATPTTSPAASVSPATSGTTTLTPEKAAQEIKSKGSSIDPVLLPAKVPAGYVVTKLENGPDGFEIEYTDSGAAKKVGLRVVMPNLPPPGANGSQAQPKFRGVKAFYQVDDTTQTAGQRWLMWTEPHTDKGSGQTEEGEPYLLSATGLTEAEFWDFANSLALVPTTLIPTPVFDQYRDGTAAIGNLKQYYSAIYSHDYKTAYDLLIRPDQSADDLLSFTREQQNKPNDQGLAGLKVVQSDPSKGDIIIQIVVHETAKHPDATPIPGKDFLLPGDKTRYVEMVRDGGIWRIAQILEVPITDENSFVVIQAQPPTVQQILDFSFINSTQGWAAGSYCTSFHLCQVLIKMTTDGGRGWQSRAALPLEPGFFMEENDNHKMVARIHFVNANDGWLYGPGFYSTHDGGASWQAEKFSEDIVELASVGNTVWATTRTCSPSDVCKFGLLLSTNNGRSWKNLVALPKLEGLAVTMLALTPQDAWLLSYSPDSRPIAPDNSAITTFAVTHDGGQSWQKLTDPTYDKGCVNTGLAAANLKELWLACGGQGGAGMQPKYLYKSGDGGKNWITVNSKGSGSYFNNQTVSGGYFNSLAVSGPGKLWVTLARGTLITSSDGGQSWNPAIPFEQVNPGEGGIGPVVFVDATHGWLASQNRIFYTTDGGATWQPVALG